MLSCRTIGSLKRPVSLQGVGQQPATVPTTLPDVRLSTAYYLMLVCTFIAAARMLFAALQHQLAELHFHRQQLSWHSVQAAHETDSEDASDKIGSLLVSSEDFDNAFGLKRYEAAAYASPASSCCMTSRHWHDLHMAVTDQRLTKQLPRTVLPAMHTSGWSSTAAWLVNMAVALPCCACHAGCLSTLHTAHTAFLQVHFCC